MIKTYSELIKLKTFTERFNYLNLNGTVCEEIFGHARYLNQQFYKSAEWKKLRNQIIIRDNGCDLGIKGREIYGRVLIHHINPLSKDDILIKSSKLTDPENLISVSLDTHNAIHYSNDSILFQEPIIRTKNDTCPWKHD